VANNQSTDDDAHESGINMLILFMIRKKGNDNFKTLRPIMEGLTLLQCLAAHVLVSNWVLM
jgi:hypothetical protein